MADPYLALIDSMAQALVTEYLSPKAAQADGSDAERTERVPLPDMDKAA